MAGRQRSPSERHALLPAQGPAGPAGLALFDLDRTLLPGSSLLALGRAMVAEGFVRRRTLVTAAFADIRFRRRGASDGQADRVRERALSLAAGLEREPLVELVAAVVDELVPTVRPALSLLLDRHRAAGDFCVVLSASPQELVDVVCARLGAHRGIGTRGEVVDGRYTGRLDGPWCYGPGKLARLRDVLGNVDLAAAWAYADSASDLPLLTACGNPVVVNPDRRLAAEASSHGWPILRLG